MIPAAAFAPCAGPIRPHRLLFGRPQPFNLMPKPRSHLSSHRIRGKLQACTASAEAAALLSAGLTKYVSGDRMGALNLFEDCLKKDPSPEDRLAALWNSMAVHAYFGDAEVAQIPLREAVALGLNFEAALQPGDPRFVKLQASAQILIQLRRFSVAAAKAIAAGEVQPPPSSSKARSGAAGAAAGSTARPASYLQQDVSGMTQTEMQGLDTSMLGVVRRVAVLLVLLIGLGVGLFYVGLQLTFPGEQ